MAIDFEHLLSAEQKRDLLTQRINQFATEAYQHELNRQIAESVQDQPAIEQAEAALVTLETAINVHQVELDGLS
jgi:hypothetical protein